MMIKMQCPECKETIYFADEKGGLSSITPDVATIREMVSINEIITGCDKCNQEIKFIIKSIDIYRDEKAIYYWCMLNDETKIIKNKYGVEK